MKYGVNQAIVFLVVAFFAASASVPAVAQEHEHDEMEEAATKHQHHSAATVPVYDNLGSHARMITTENTQTQVFFDQGLRLEYAFNHAEAIRSYGAALMLDAQCAMCYWGIALASGPNINAAMDEESAQRAFESIRMAQELATAVALSQREKDLIQALAKRYSDDPEADRGSLDQDFAEAMESLAAKYPDDSDILTLYAASLMNLRPWDYWSGDYENRSANPGTVPAIDALETALEVNPDNPGACHYYIHLVEAAFPEKAEECADRLPELMPGAGHIVHMPGHVYIRVGRYHDAVKANEHAVHSDETYIADQSPMGIYPAAYYPHNYHFMAFAATMAGMSEKAMEAAKIVSPKVPHEIALEVPWIQNAIVFPQLTAVTFGRWDELLQMPKPSAELYHAVAMDAYARGVAWAANGNVEKATSAVEKIREAEAKGNPDGDNKVFAIAAHALQGEIALRSGNPTEAVEHFVMAADLEDDMLYDEPPLWYYPIRHSLGRALLEADRPADAEKSYRSDLARFRKNGWSLYGLAQSLEAQGKSEQAAEVKQQFDEAWTHADVELVASRF